MEVPTPSPAPSATPDAANTLVRHFDADVQEAYGRFRKDRSPHDADVVVLAIVIDHLPKKESRRAGELLDSHRLVEDLGFDSIAITEMVFFIEDLFQVRIGNEEILRVRTVGDLRAFIREKLAAAGVAARA